MPWRTGYPSRQILRSSKGRWLRVWCRRSFPADTIRRVQVPSNRRFALFDSLRAIAALSVVVFHAAGFSGVNLTTWYGGFTSKLNVGVTLFFLISSFLLYRPHAVALFGGSPAPGLADYALRRTFRILPAYWVALTVLALWPGLSGVLTKDWWVYYGLFQSYRLVWAFQGIPVAWSLSVELAFYALLPLLAAFLAAMGRLFGPRGKLALPIVTFSALGIASLAFRASEHRSGDMELLGSIFAHFLGFAAGLSLAVVSACLEGRAHRHWSTRWVVTHPTACWALAAGVFVAMSVSPHFPRPFSRAEHTTAAYIAEQILYVLMATLVMLPAVFAEEARSLPQRLLGSRWLTWIGRISYGVFLWHVSVLLVMKPLYGRGFAPVTALLVSLALAVPPVLLLGWVSWRWVEEPALGLARRLGARGALARTGNAPENGRGA